MDKKKWAILHTTEHVFARSLQELGLDIHVRKADTARENNVGEVFIKEIIPIDKLLEAERGTNGRITEGLDVSESVFPGLDAARGAFPKLRFNEDRLPDIEKSGNEIRVVRIGDFDFSACKQAHAANTGEATVFIITDVSYLKGETKITFEVGNEALKELMDLEDSLVSLGMKYNFKPRQISKHYESLRDSLDDSRKCQRELFSLILDSGKKIVDVGSVRMADFYGVMEDFLKRNPSRTLFVISESQVFIAKGQESSYDVIGLGGELEKVGFKGKIQEESINGRNTPDVTKRLEEIVNG